MKLIHHLDLDHDPIDNSEPDPKAARTVCNLLGESGCDSYDIRVATGLNKLRGSHLSSADAVNDAVAALGGVDTNKRLESFQALSEMPLERLEVLHSSNPLTMILASACNR